MAIEPADGAPVARPDAVQTSAVRGELQVSALVADASVALFMLALAVALWIGVGAFAPGPWRAQGAGSFPRSIALLLGLCSLLLLGRTLLAWRARTRARPLAFRRPHAVAAAMGLALAYPPLIEALGYYPATALWLPLLLWVAGCRKPKLVVLPALGFLVFSWIVFQQLLGTPMP
ncbi:MAG: tripartite tricarboxylate transporter TctB family protein [Burkholderiales bacterium]|nr:tripartite tricarboxylate transporter TctB family protein [Burkholderiales bacterium]MDE1927146.1 tripartite tricarboxylate transporter TctB family protein [Burkholderiales bacterium]MDE2157958.1 tripartite tricarboxylate transporter TctB family protein [Burkholderiales bacterium]